MTLSGEGHAKHPKIFGKVSPKRIRQEFCAYMVICSAVVKEDRGRQQIFINQVMREKWWTATRMNGPKEIIHTHIFQHNRPKNP